VKGGVGGSGWRMPGSSDLAFWRLGRIPQMIFVEAKRRRKGGKGPALATGRMMALAAV